MNLSKFKQEGENAYKKIKQLRDEVLELNDDDETTQYILAHLNNIVAALKEIFNFVKANAAKLLMSNTQALTALEELLNQKLQDIGQIDLNPIHIQQKKACRAASALLTVFNTLNALMPSPSLESALQALTQKIADFQASGHNPISPEQINNYNTLNTYMKHELKFISELEHATEKLSHYQALRQFIREKKIMLDETAKKPNSSHFQGLLWHVSMNQHQDLVHELNIKIKTEKKTILTAFNASQMKFLAKYHQLLERVDDVDLEHYKKTFKPAIFAMQTLLVSLTQASNEFKKSGDLDLFQKTIEENLTSFQGQIHFETHRAHPWIVKYLIKPFESLKKELDQLFDWQWTKPTQTKTSQAFTIYKHELLTLASPEKKGEKEQGPNL